MKELVVPSKFNNKKLQSFLMHNFPSLTNSLFYKTLRKKDIKINNNIFFIKLLPVFRFINYCICPR